MCDKIERWLRHYTIDLYHLFVSQITNYNLQIFRTEVVELVEIGVFYPFV